MAVSLGVLELSSRHMEMWRWSRMCVEYCAPITTRLLGQIEERNDLNPAALRFWRQSGGFDCMQPLTSVPVAFAPV